jgi:hypothetical protein
MFKDYVRDAGQLFEATPTKVLVGMPAFADCIFQSKPDLPDRQSMCLGAGLYFITYHDVLIYIGEFLGRSDDAFRGDLFSARWVRHISTISLRGHRISISPRLQEEFTRDNPEHDISAKIKAADPVMLGRDRGFQVSRRRLMFAASNWSVFQQAPDQWLANLKFGYVQLEEAFWRSRGFENQRIWTAIDAAERGAIDIWRPQLNGGVQNAATTAVNPTALLASLKAILQGELENVAAGAADFTPADAAELLQTVVSESVQEPKVDDEEAKDSFREDLLENGEAAPADSPPAHAVEPSQTVVSEIRQARLRTDDDEARDAFREGLPEGCLADVIEVIIRELQTDHGTEVHYTGTNGGDLRVRVLDVARPRNVFTIYWQSRNNRLFGRALAPFGDVAQLAGITTAVACPDYEPLWCQFTVDCSGEAAAAAVAAVVRLAVHNLRTGVADPR